MSLYRTKYRKACPYNTTVKIFCNGPLLAQDVDEWKRMKDTRDLRRRMKIIWPNTVSNCKLHAKLGQDILIIQDKIQKGMSSEYRVKIFCSGDRLAPEEDEYG
ncbi:hypothetical protein CDAR_240821 [Caerostris darwini]|uniref:Uncharacterized protein n=1 Tax=Caerostris darwini TaxID=1538125 RepID=A0AAV4UAC1_9ARAC|nr:hypothetical protein CDAR_240821 [Caerostris darwini]